MARNAKTSAVIDGILTMLVSGGVLAAASVAPNVIMALDKPLRKYFNVLNEHARERELQRIMQYMRSRRLIANDYEHGIQITSIGRLRLQQHSLQALYIQRPGQWDHIWRLLIFDVPEERNRSRRLLTKHLRMLGFQQLQQSAWVHPFPCKKVIEKLCNELNIARFASYLEVVGIQNEHQLIKRFEEIL